MDLDAELARLKRDVSAIKGLVEGDNLTKLLALVNNPAATGDDQATAVAALTSEVSDVKTAVGDLQTSISALQSKIDGLTAPQPPALDPAETDAMTWLQANRAGLEVLLSLGDDPTNNGANSGSGATSGSGGGSGADAGTTLTGTAGTANGGGAGGSGGAGSMASGGASGQSGDAGTSITGAQGSGGNGTDGQPGLPAGSQGADAGLVPGTNPAAQNEQTGG